MSKHVAASASVLIDRPVDDVFAFFADAENSPRWRSGVISIRRVGEDLGVGTVYEQSVAGPGGRPIRADIRLTAYEAGRRVAFETIAGPVRPRGEYLFEPVEGGTRVVFDLAADLDGVKALLMAGPVQKTMDAEVAALAKAKDQLEHP
ncbi:SRPBCC family protein [Raineyella fluvialis]|uniref:Polyketide cyclase / dehydrase and lipid transport n=1 Tax=Raineyella fluvialis TaxID=2662261 RepID=A0A5Q2FAN2_9ACTN|nr:SRPBCC family protein [Raineyella fluvialis]QGF24040.1 hypothetical protein Rai3103_10510 [Raineyella fluvialis]